MYVFETAQGHSMHHESAPRSVTFSSYTGRFCVQLGGGAVFVDAKRGEIVRRTAFSSSSKSDSSSSTASTIEATAFCIDSQQKRMAVGNQVSTTLRIVLVKTV
jgi:hypothetical protein